MTVEDLSFSSRTTKLAGRLFLPDTGEPAPALVVCHGAGESKENYEELCRFLVTRGIAALAIDMHGHGASGGKRYYVEIEDWVADVRAAVALLSARPEVAANRIGAIGLSSGGTAILEAALEEPRLQALIALAPTVHNSLPFGQSLLFQLLGLVGHVKRWLTQRDLDIPLAYLAKGVSFVADPGINESVRQRIEREKPFLPLPGGLQSFIVDTIRRVQKIKVPVRIIWGDRDEVDSVATAHLLFRTLTCKKSLEIIPGNGHATHLDRDRELMFSLAAGWAMENLVTSRVGHDAVATIGTEASSAGRLIVGEEAKALTADEKWRLFSPHLKRHGGESLAYATLQAGLEYYVEARGYLAFTSITHPVFARKTKRIVLSDPICAPEERRALIENFLRLCPRLVFGVISEACADTLRELGFKVNCLGFEAHLPVQTYKTEGNWKELDLIKRARNEARREGISIQEVDITTVDPAHLAAVSSRWIGGKRVNDREIWIYARRPVLAQEPDVRKFIAYDRDGHIVGFTFYDPMYRAGKIIGYSANIARCDEQRFGKLATAINMVAAEKFRAEGKQTLSLLLAPFVKLDGGKYNDDLSTKWFFQLSERYGNDIYNFKGLAFHKSKYRVPERYLYLASNSAMPSNDVYLAFLSADITRSYFTTVAQLLRGIWKETFARPRQQPLLLPVPPATARPQERSSPSRELRGAPNSD